MYLIAADIIVLLHFLWIVFLVFGAFPGRKYKWVKRLHISGIVFALFIQMVGWYCPFTHLETWLRKAHEPAQSYNGSFIVYYVEKLVYVSLPPHIIIWLTALLGIISVCVYLYKPARRKTG